MKTRLTLILIVVVAARGIAQYAPAANVSGTTAIHKDSSIIVNWANEVIDFQRGPEDIATGSSLLASFGDSTEALAIAEGTATDVVSLGDGGQITLAFAYPIKNGVGPDFAVFENSFSHDYLEFAHVEVSTDGVHFVRMPSISATQTVTQTSGFGLTPTTQVHNLAGKYIQGYGTPFDLEDVSDSLNINLDSINFVKIIDVIGSVDLNFGSFDSQGTIINDPYPTAFASGGFDLDAVAVINESNPFLSIQRKEIEIILHPNPTSDYVYIDGYEGSFELLSMSGQIILTGQVVQHQAIQISDIGHGFYVFHFGDYVRKLVVNE